MAYESIAEHLDQIEKLLVQDLSPQAIANQLGIPEKQKTIYRYKKEVFDFKQAASEEWTQEKQKGHAERLKAGKDRIIDDYEFLNRLKLKADSLLDFKVGDTYRKIDRNGDEIQGVVTPHSLAEIYGKAGQIGTAAIKAEQEMAGETKPEINVTVQNEIKLDDILKDYYGSEDASGGQNPEGNGAGQSVHSAQADQEASPISDQPKA